MSISNTRKRRALEQHYEEPELVGIPDDFRELKRFRSGDILCFYTPEESDGEYIQCHEDFVVTPES